MKRIKTDYQCKPILWKSFIGCVSDDGSEFYMLLHHMDMDSAIKFISNNIIHEGNYHYFEYKGMGCQDAFIDDITLFNDACIATYRAALLNFDKLIIDFHTPKQYASYYDGKRIIITEIQLPEDYTKI